MMDDNRAGKLAFYHFYDILAMYKSSPNLDEKYNGLKATILTAIDDKNLGLSEFVHLVEFAFEDE